MKMIEHIKEIYEKYRNLEAKDIDLYIKSLIKKYPYSESYIKKVIKDYVKTLSQEDQEEYNLKIKKQKEYKCIMQNHINHYVKTKSKLSVLELLKMQSSSSICDYLDNYLIQNPKNIQEITKLKQELILLEQQIINKNVYKDYLESGNCLQSIINLISLLFCNEEDAILLLKGYSIPKIIFDRNLEQFANLFPDQSDDLEYLKNLYKKYATAYKIILEETDPYYKEGIELLRKIVDSKDCLLMYISKHGMTDISEMNKLFREIKKLKNLEYTHLIEIIQSRDNSKFEKYLEEIVFQIYGMEDFEIIDYYELTKLSPRGLKNYIRKYIPNEKIKNEVIRKINLAFKITAYTLYSQNSILSKKNLKENQQKVLEFLKQNGIPTTKFFLEYYVEKYEKGGLDLETGKVKKVSK